MLHESYASIAQNGLTMGTSCYLVPLHLSETKGSIPSWLTSPGKDLHFRPDIAQVLSIWKYTSSTFTH